jgi:hypothetical protein
LVKHPAISDDPEVIAFIVSFRGSAGFIYDKSQSTPEKMRMLSMTAVSLTQRPFSPKIDQKSEKRQRLILEKTRKLLYYTDLRLLLKILITALKISFVSSTKGYHSVIASMPPTCTHVLSQTDIDKIYAYVNLYFIIRRKLGIRDTCLTYSVFLCHVLVQVGVNAKINFGAKMVGFKSETGSNMIGHCWVTVGEQEVITDYQLLCKHP